MPLEDSEHAQVSDVSAVEDVHGLEGTKAFGEIGVRAAVGVGDDGDGVAVSPSRLEVFAHVLELRAFGPGPLHTGIMDRKPSVDQVQAGEHDDGIKPTAGAIARVHVRMALLAPKDKIIVSWSEVSSKLPPAATRTRSGRLRT